MFVLNWAQSTYNSIFKGRLSQDWALTPRSNQAPLTAAWLGSHFEFNLNSLNELAQIIYLNLFIGTTHVFSAYIVIPSNRPYQLPQTLKVFFCQHNSSIGLRQFEYALESSLLPWQSSGSVLDPRLMPHLSHSNTKGFYTDKPLF